MMTKEKPELKTLDDILADKEVKSVLRKEAIKWIDDAENNSKSLLTFFLDMEGISKIEFWERWIIHFFNLTDDDLKEVIP
ncbi:MAG: hypothetical protein ACTSRS_22815 [Candidatus Helarchaeota archaeon]